MAERHSPPWVTCEAVISETFYLAGAADSPHLMELLTRKVVRLAFSLDSNHDTVLRLMEKYADVPMSFADACLVRMTEILAEPLILTTDSDFKIYRRNSRHVVPCVTPIRD